MRPVAWRLWLHARIPCPARLDRRTGADDLRRHERDHERNHLKELLMAASPAFPDGEGVASIGRESCRQSVCQDVEITGVAVSVKKKKKTQEKHTSSKTKK